MTNTKHTLGQMNKLLVQIERKHTLAVNALARSLRSGPSTATAQKHRDDYEHHSIDFDEKVALMRCLIASAPDLLMALEELADEADRVGSALSAKGQGATVLGMKTRKARAAIAKARGQA